MQEIRNSSSASHQGRPWLLYLAVLMLHVAVLAAMDTALSVGRLAALEPSSVEVAIVQEKLDNPRVPPKAKSAVPPVVPPVLPPIEVPTPPDAAPSQPAVATSTLPEPLQPHPEPTPEVIVPQALPPVALRPAVLPASTELRYKLIKGNDSAKASLHWRVLPSGSYELTLEATYFGFSALKQTSAGSIDTAGLVPLRYGDKRRGKSEQAAHFDRAKNVITYSNNRPESPLVAGWQDRASMLIQLGGMLAADAHHYAAGTVIHMPISNVDELETWAFDVHGREVLELPIGQREAIKLTRRSRRAFDQTVELWLAPAEHYLPVRIRLTDSSGVTDQQLTGRD